MNITLSTIHLRPATMAAMIADLLDSPVVNAATIKALIQQLEISVGEEDSIEFLAEVGVTPGRGAAEYKEEWAVVDGLNQRIK